MVSYQIVCIITPDESSTHEQITQIGYDDNGTVYLLPTCTAISRIEKNSKEFYVKADGEKVYVNVYQRDSRKFLKTKPDDAKNDKLLRLSLM
jgi:hypothetical protein